LGNGHCIVDGMLITPVVLKFLFRHPRARGCKNMLMNHLYLELNFWNAEGSLNFCKILAALGSAILMPQIKKVCLD